MQRRKTLAAWGLYRLLETSEAVSAPRNSRGYGHMPLAVRNNTLRKGPGGRHSVSGVIATVFGATGFLGRYVVNALAKMGTQVVVPYRCDDIDMQHLRQMGDLGQIVCLPEFNVRDDELIRYAVSQSSVVVNLMGAQAETWNYSFHDIHVDAARRVAQVAAASPLCERFVHVSALGARSSAPSMRLRSKAEGNQQVLEALPTATILNPGYMIGIEDRFYNLIASLGKSLPYVPLIDGGVTNVQPVYVRDVADALIEVLRTKDTCGKTYNLAGPDVISMREAVELVYREMREKSTTMHVPASVARMLVWPHTLLHKKLPLHYFSYFLTADFIDELSQDLLLDKKGLSFEDLDMQPRSVMKGLPIDHIRFWRAGGYDFGATAGTEDP